MRHRTKYRFSPTKPLRTLAWVLISAIVIAAPVYSDARDISQVRELPQARDSIQARNAPQSGSNSPAGNAVQAREIIGASDSIRITVFQNPDLMALQHLFGEFVVLHAQTEEGRALRVRYEGIEIVDVELGLQHGSHELVQLGG
jgi:hypothetical protein